ncbi:hypothetical protein LDENG_00206580 [Lucifuga dentata]|nr:hypothetical protein LDENG_00206580 [Lucifuga dentata]
MSSALIHLLFFLLPMVSGQHGPFNCVIKQEEEKCLKMMAAYNPESDAEIGGFSMNEFNLQTKNYVDAEAVFQQPL